MWNTCMSVLPNTRAWEQEERNKIREQTKKVREWKELKQAQKNGLSLPNQNTIIINKIW